MNTAAAQDFPATIDLSTLDGTTGFRIDGVNQSDYSGRSVSAAGDINGDGVDDLIVGANGSDPNGNNNAGSSYVVFGRDIAMEGNFGATLALSTLDGTNGFRIDGVSPGHYSGRSVSAAGDINGDGVDDLIVGADGADPGGNTNAGSSYVVFGRDVAVVGDFAPLLALSALDGSTGFRLDGVNQDDRSGVSVSAAGDVNGDGVDDLIVGANRADPNGDTEAGSSYVVFGRDVAVVGNFSPTLALSALVGSNGFRIDGVSEDDFSGRSVSGAGDINGDGVQDLIVGAFGADPNGNAAAGRSYVVFGRDVSSVGNFGPTLALSTLNGTNGFRLDGVNETDNSGSSVRGAGDINGDGVDDLIVGALLADSNGNEDAGSSYVVLGRDVAVLGDFGPSLALSALDGTNGFRIDGVNEDDRSGASVSGAGDINGDGVDDLIVGANRAAPNGNANAGSSYVVLGRDVAAVGDFGPTLALSALNGTTGFRVDGVNESDISGASVSGAGDINGDGVDDLIVGALGADPNGNSSAGSSYVVFGGNDGPGSGRIEVRADQASVNFGPVPLGGTVSTTVTLINQASTEPQLGTLSVDGLASISIINDTCSGQQLGTIATVDDRCTFDIEINLTEPGSISGQIIAPYNSSLGPEVVLVSAFPDGVFINSFED